MNRSTQGIGGHTRADFAGQGLILLILIAVVFGMMVWFLPPFINAIAFIFGELLLCGAMIWLASWTMRSNMLANQKDEAVKVISGQTEANPLITVPEMPVFLRRNAFVLAGVILSWGLLWGGMFALVGLLGSLARASNNPSADALSLIVIVPMFVFVLYTSILMLAVVGAIVDRYIQKNEVFQQTFYDPENDPLDGRKLLKSLGVIIIGAGLYGGAFMIQLASRSANFEDSLPTWTGYACLAGTILMPLFGFWWLASSLTRTPAQVNEIISNAIEEEFGKDSEEYRQFELDRQRQEGSIEGQANNRVFGYLFRGIGALLTAVMLASLLMVATNVPTETRQWIIIALLAFGIIGLFWLLSQTELNIQSPPEFKLIEQAIHDGDYTAAKAHADELARKLPPIESNFAIAMAYSVAGEPQRAYEAAQEALTVLMARDAEHRNPQQVALYLWVLGSSLSAQAQYPEAITALNQALQYDPQHIGVYHGLGETHLYNNQPQLALDYFEKALTLNDSQPQPQPLTTLRMAKALALTLLGQTKEADRIMKEAFELVDKTRKPVMADMYYWAGRIALERGLRGRADEFFKRAIETDGGGEVTKRTQQTIARFSSGT